MRSPGPALTLVLVSFLFTPAVTAGEFPIHVDETTLENGMKVYCVKRPGDPQAACILAVRSGSAAERPGYTGIAHFLEHMLFKGTDKIGVKDPAKDRKLRHRIDEVMAELLRLEDEGAGEDRLAPIRKERDRLFAEQQENLVTNHVGKIYSDAGSSMTNAFTSNDMTAFIAVLPSHKTELFFWVEAERFCHPVFRQFHSEKNVVREERRLSENRPGHVFREELERVIFGAHTYAHPVIGYHEDLRRLTREDMRAFFDTYHTPDNMFVVVFGDVDSDEVFRQARRYFGGWKRHVGKRPRVPLVPRAKSGPARVYGTGPGSASLTVAYRLPPAGRETDVEADMIALLLGDEQGDLAERLVRRRGVATAVSAAVDSRVYGSVLLVEVEMAEGHAPEEAEADVLEAVQRLVDAPVDDETIAMLRRRYRAEVLGFVKSDMRMGFAFLQHEVTGSWRDIDRNLARARTSTPEEIRALAAEHLVATNRVVGIYTAKARPATKPVSRPAEPAPEAVPDTERLPESWTDLEFPRRPLSVPSAEGAVFTLENGVRVVAVEDPDEPAVRIEAILRGGSAEDPEGREGAAQVLAETLGLSGTAALDRKAVRELLEEIVGEYRVTADRFALRFSLDTFPRDWVAGLGLFRDLVRSTRLDAAAAEAEKEKLKSRLLDRDAQPGFLNRRAFRELCWAGDVRTRRATSESVEALDLAELERAYARHRDPRRLILVVSGPFERRELVERLEETFGTWRPSAGPVPEIPATIRPSAAPGLYVMDFDSSQGYVLIGARTAPATDARHPALWTLQTVLSQRIFNRIRSNEGLAYQAGARLTPDWEIPSLFSVVFQTKNRSVPFAISLALEELEKIAKTGPDAEEIVNARQTQRARLSRTLGRSSARAGAFADLLLHPGAGLDWYPRFRAGVVDITPEAVRAVAAELLAREDLVIVCVGNREEMEAGDGEHPQKLTDFGPIHVLAAPAAAGNPDTPSAVVLAAVRALSRGDLDSLLPLVGGALRTRLEAPEARQQLGRQARFLGDARYEVTESTEAGDAASVTVAYSISRGEETMEVSMAYTLERIEGRWRCVDFRPKGR